MKLLILIISVWHMMRDRLISSYLVASQNDEDLVMFPNERTSLDDCHLRYYKLLAPSVVSPAFGTPAHFKEFAHMGAIGWTQPDGTMLWQCGGTLILENFVLTAAHCAVDLNNRPPNVVRFGDLNLYSSDDDMYAQQLNVVEVVRHPEHKFSANYHDVALLRLEKNVTLHDTVVPACLWTDTEVRFKKLEATGWGRTGFSKDQTPVLLKVTLKPIQNHQCSEFYGNDTRKLRSGIQDHHICAVDEKMDTCEGDSGGPLQIKLMHNANETPFIVGITSFGGVCGTGSPGVYTRVVSYHEWIVSAMQKRGAAVDENTFNATVCALRYVQYREYDDAVANKSFTGNEYYVTVDTTKRRIKVDRDVEQMVKIGWNTAGNDNCYGVVVDEDTILTVADCTHFNRSPATYITYLKDKTMSISKIYVHPEFREGSGYNNIAILRLSKLLDLPIKYQPSCIYHGLEFPGGGTAGNGRIDINQFVKHGETVALDPTMSTLWIRSRVHNESSCIVSERHLQRLQRGLASEHVCMGHDAFLVPHSCDLMIGGPTYTVQHVNSRRYDVTIALSQFGRDCGFGEHMVATRLASHVEWMKSVLLPNYRDASALHFLDSDLSEGNSCQAASGTMGRCVNFEDCTKHRSEISLKAKFCATSNIICCPLENIAYGSSSQVHPDLLNCPKLVSNILRRSPFGSMVHVELIKSNRQERRCFGAIITKFIVVTTASCLEEEVPNFVKILSKISTSYEIERVVKHYAFDSTDNSNDIALVRLRNPLSWSSDVYPACLWTNTTHVPLVMDIVFPTLATLESVNKVLPMYNTDCQRTHPYTLQSSQLCGKNATSESACIVGTDQLRWDRSDGVSFLVGLGVHSVDCVNRRYTLFTRMASFLDWFGQNAF